MLAKENRMEEKLNVIVKIIYVYVENIQARCK
jgi:hypothetical protein